MEGCMHARDPLEYYYDIITYLLYIITNSRTKVYYYYLILTSELTRPKCLIKYRCEFIICEFKTKPFEKELVIDPRLIIIIIKSRQ